MPLREGGTLLAAWNGNASALVLAFAASNQTRAAAASNATQAPFYLDAFAGNGTKGTLLPADDPFAGIVASSVHSGAAAGGSALQLVLPSVTPQGSALRLFALRACAVWQVGERKVWEKVSAFADRRELPLVRKKLSS